jgi:hypothetical protein
MPMSSESDSAGLNIQEHRNSSALKVSALKDIASVLALVDDVVRSLSTADIHRSGLSIS